MMGLLSQERRKGSWLDLGSPPPPPAPGPLWLLPGCPPGARPSALLGFCVCGGGGGEGLK